MKPIKTKFLKSVILILALSSLLAGFYMMPLMAEQVATSHVEFAFLKWPVMIFVNLSLIPFFVVLASGFQLLNLIEKNNAFSELTLRHFKRIKTHTLFIAIWYFIGLGFMLLQEALQIPVLIIGGVIIFTTLTFSFFAQVLHDVLKSALELKNENDLTV